MLDRLLHRAAVTALRRPLPTGPKTPTVRTCQVCQGEFVDSLAVTGKHRRSGVGSALMRAVEQWGRSQGAQVIILETESNNPMSVPFYERRMGFSAQATIFRKEIDPSAA